MECRCCGHEHMVWDEIKKGYAWKDTEPFIQIEGDFIGSTGRSPIDEVFQVSIWACQKCNMIQMKSEKKLGANYRYDQN